MIGPFPFLCWLLFCLVVAALGFPEEAGPDDEDGAAGGAAGATGTGSGAAANVAAAGAAADADADADAGADADAVASCFAVAFTLPAWSALVLAEAATATGRTLVMCD